MIKIFLMLLAVIFAKPLFFPTMLRSFASYSETKSLESNVDWKPLVKLEYNGTQEGLMEAFIELRNRSSTLNSFHCDDNGCKPPAIHYAENLFVDALINSTIAYFDELRIESFDGISISYTNIPLVYFKILHSNNNGDIVDFNLKKVYDTAKYLEKGLFGIILLFVIGQFSLGLFFFFLFSFGCCAYLKLKKE